MSLIISKKPLKQGANRPVKQPNKQQKKTKPPARQKVIVRPKKSLFDQPSREYLRMASHPSVHKYDGALLPDGNELHPVAIRVSSLTRVITGTGWSISAVSGLMILPHPVLQIVPTGNAYVLTQQITPQNTTFTPTVEVGTAPQSVCGPLSDSYLASLASAYRVTACGVRIRSVLNVNKTALDVLVRFVPVSGKCPPVTALQMNKWKQADSLAYALTGASPANFDLNMGETKRFTTYDIFNKELNIVFKPEDDSFQEWRSTTQGTAAAQMFDVATTGETAGDYVMATTSTGVVDTSAATGFSPKMDGWPALFITMRGGDDNSYPVLEVEVDLHMEYVQVSALTQGFVGKANQSPGNGTTVQQITRALGRAKEFFVTAGSGLTDFASTTAGTVGKLAIMNGLEL